VRTFRVTVNGQVFDVQVEEIGHAPAVTGVSLAEPVSRPPAAPASTAAPPPVPRASVQPPSQAAAPPAATAGRPVARQDKAAVAGAARADGSSVTAPLPGTILDVRVAAGQEVSAGQVLCILEAMKMENEIVASRGGTVQQVNAQRGQAVNAGDLLFVIK